MASYPWTWSLRGLLSIIGTILGLPSILPCLGTNCQNLIGNGKIRFHKHLFITFKHTFFKLVYLTVSHKILHGQHPNQNTLSGNIGSFFFSLLTELSYLNINNPPPLPIYEVADFPSPIKKNLLYYNIKLNEGTFYHIKYSPTHISKIIYQSKVRTYDKSELYLQHLT